MPRCKRRRGDPTASYTFPATPHKSCTACSASTRSATQPATHLASASHPLDAQQRALRAACTCHLAQLCSPTPWPWPKQTRDWLSRQRPFHASKAPRKTGRCCGSWCKNRTGECGALRACPFLENACTMKQAEECGRLTRHAAPPIPCAPLERALSIFHTLCSSRAKTQRARWKVCASTSPSSTPCYARTKMCTTTRPTRSSISISS